MKIYNDKTTDTMKILVIQWRYNRYDPDRTDVDEWWVHNNNSMGPTPLPQQTTAYYGM